MGLYDIIFFNPPYYKGIPKNNFEIAYKGGERLEVIHRFLRASKNYLKKGGYICMIISSDMGIDELSNMVISHGLSINIITKYKKLFETFYIVRIVT
ncbi:MAG TPA: hypothetical protein VI387_07330 [Candidatus Brocadiales bacterium]|nr:hypothetical protein [Candidatus Brocadiales bacterium]